ncbi:class I SAM-dependent methyltransferase [Marinobacterium rhizophilum]|uniref:class I SAM-dependent methyltransferase n=1 Tax=Marinobacterium rhizophilum TaxID=420402 RepID=UPI000370F482|nr:class I SAM-dependent methyltransferase [Marinobacterium rhizophilum]
MTQIPPLYSTLIFLGCGSHPPLAALQKVAEHLWLIDADQEVVEGLQGEHKSCLQLGIRQALVDTEKRLATFNVYNLPWANGIHPVSVELKALYPGLSCLRKCEQLTSDICTLVAELLGERNTQNLLVIDLGEEMQPLLDKLEGSGQLLQFSAVVVIQSRHSSHSLKPPVSVVEDNVLLRSLADSLSPHAQVFTLHPLAEDNLQLTKKLAAVTQHQQIQQHVLAELNRQREELEAENAQLLEQNENVLLQYDLNIDALMAEQAKVVKLEKECNLLRRRLAKFRVQRELATKNLRGTYTAEKEKAHYDNFYRAFEDKFRGTREKIKKRVAVYLSFVAPISDKYPELPALDLGCGRGEWLELLQEHGIDAEGVDRDLGMLSACRERGLNVMEGDVAEYLEKLPDASRICISLIHVVEHIAFETLRTIVEQAKRILVPEGILIMETPNPENYTVGTCNFYMDPTHRNPLPPPLLAFVCEYYGYKKVKVLRLQENTELKYKAKFEFIYFLKGISPDYAVIAAKYNSDLHLAEIWDIEYGISFAGLEKSMGIIE